MLTDVPEADGRLRFAHMVIRDTLYQQLTAPTPWHLHRRALGALGAEAPLSERAHHALAAHDLAQGIDLARRAGERARELHAYEEAVRMYQVALDALRDDDALRCELLLALGEAEIRAGDLPAGKRAFLDAATIAQRLGLARQLARAAYGYAGRMVYARAGSDRLIVTLLEQALAALGDADPELRILLLARWRARRATSAHGSAATGSVAKPRTSRVASAAPRRSRTR